MIDSLDDPTISHNFLIFPARSSPMESGSDFQEFPRKSEVTCPAAAVEGTASVDSQMRLVEHETIERWHKRNLQLVEQIAWAVFKIADAVGWRYGQDVVFQCFQLIYFTGGASRPSFWTFSCTWHFTFFCVPDAFLVRLFQRFQFRRQILAHDVSTNFIARCLYMDHFGTWFLVKSLLHTAKRRVIIHEQLC